MPVNRSVFVLRTGVRSVDFLLELEGVRIAVPTVAY